MIGAGLTWIGPSPDAIDALGDKVTARRVAQRVGAPLAPGTDGPVADADEVRAFAEQYGLPVAVKAAYGGGGRGLKVARTMAEIPEAFESATREAVSAFGRGECFVEKFLDRPRHVETQCLADAAGNVVIISTRDCSLQRRNQKLVEEAPAPFLTDDQDRVLREGSRAILREVGDAEYLDPRAAGGNGGGEPGDDRLRTVEVSVLGTEERLEHRRRVEAGHEGSRLVSC